MPKIRSLDPVFVKKRNLIDFIRGEMRRQHISQNKMADEMGIYESGLSYKFSHDSLYIEDLIRILMILKVDKETIGDLLV